MGEVYRAQDTRLDRTVAIKILPAEVTANASARQRFEREAKTISSLNHPNICVLYDIGHQDGVDYIVMECLEGETLAKRLERGALPTDQALKYGAQIAEALEKAHRSGIVHRDLKPGNIMLTATCTKLLDFGLAKELVPMGSLATLTTARAVSPVTQEGTIVGTFQYMSPEQVEGKEVDGRSDIFSLGAVLYEMLTGNRAFTGKTQLSVASAILEREPEPLNIVKPLTPRALERVVERCLAKDPGQRWQTGRDLASELTWISEGGSQSAAAIAKPAPNVLQRAWLAWLISGVLAALLVSGAIWWGSSKPVEQVKYFAAPLGFAAKDMAVAPNGHTVAVVGFNVAEHKNVLWLYELGERGSKSVAGTEDASFSFWSPDGKTLGFFSEGKLKRVDIAGGPVQTLCDAPNGRGGTWNASGDIIFVPTGETGQVLTRISASGGAPTPISVLDASRNETSHRWPIFLPDGKHYLFLTFNLSPQASVDAIFVGELGSNKRKFLVKADANPAYAAPGNLLFFRDGTLFAQHFDVDKLELTGTPSPILTDVQQLPRIGRALFAVSNSGLLVAQSATEVSLSRLQWFDRKGKEIGVVGKPEVFANIELGPDGKTVALDKTDPSNQNADVWIYALQGEGVKRMTFDPAIDALPVWSPDGKNLVFTSGRKTTLDLFLKSVDGTQDEKTIEASAMDDKYPNSWSHDGKYILYTRRNQLWVFNFNDLKSQLFLKGPSAVRSGQFSPDGKWVGYASNETGKWEIYVTSFPDAKGKWQISNGGGTQPRWRGDGKELFYLSPDNKMMAVPLAPGAVIDAGTPIELFQASPREMVATSEMAAYDVTKDGQRFLINTQVKGADTPPMSVILNWSATLKQ
jgi:eukaryotic-like serine/threonine-protein kinase